MYIMWRLFHKTEISIVPFLNSAEREKRNLKHQIPKYLAVLIADSEVQEYSLLLLGDCISESSQWYPGWVNT